MLSIGRTTDRNKRAFVISVIVGIVFGFTFASVLIHIMGDSPRNIIHTRMSCNQTINSHEKNELKMSVEDSVEKLKYNGTIKRAAKILCFVLTQEANHEAKAKHVKATWGRRFDKVLFMSSVKDDSLPTISLQVPEGRQYLWGKTKEAFKYVYQHYNDTYDWYMKADDDTYVVVENLRYLLNAYNPDEPFYLGCNFKPSFARHIYMQGGAGYVLSKEALRRFVVDGIERHKCRQEDIGSEDLYMGECLGDIGINASDTRDHLGRPRFYTFSAALHLNPYPPGPDFWYWSYIVHPEKMGPDCCSDRAVSFHYVAPVNMYVYEYLLYQLRLPKFNRSTLT